MSARSDHSHGKTPASHPNQQAVNGVPVMRSEEYEGFNQYQQQVNGYNGTAMIPSPNGEQGYFNYYHQPQSNHSYQTFFGGESGNAWSTGQTGDALAYFGHYTGMTNGTGSDYMGFPSAQYDYTGGQFGSSGWGYSNDYASNTNWNLQGTQVNGLKPDSSPQYQYAGYGDFGAGYPATDVGIPGNVPASNPQTNGALSLEGHLSLSEPNTVTELGQGIQQLGITSEETETNPSTSEIQVVEQSTSGSSISTTENSNSSSAPKKAPKEVEAKKTKPSKPMSWAQLASLPAKPAPPKPVEPKSVPSTQPQQRPVQQSGAAAAASGGSKPNDTRGNVWSGQQRVQRLNNNSINNNANNSDARKAAAVKSESEVDPTLNKLKKDNTYNPKNFDLAAKNARFFVIKSYSEDDIHRAIKYGVWCSTEHGNKRLNNAFHEQRGKGPIYLFYSVNGSGHFCGMAQMMSGVDAEQQAGVWTQDKWKGSMEIKWIYVKDVPNGHLRHIRLENNENKPVTNSRDTQEVPVEKGRQVLKTIHQFKHSTSIFDDFSHYEKKEEEEDGMKRKNPSASSSGGSISTNNARR